jgi:hypothetical protein
MNNIHIDLSPTKVLIDAELHPERGKVIRSDI